MTMRSRFIPDGILGLFERRVHNRAVSASVDGANRAIRVDVATRMREMWD
jgi:hypothetical protein